MGKDSVRNRAKRRSDVAPSAAWLDAKKEQFEATPLLCGALDWALLVMFTALSFATRFYKLTTPSLVLFDEVHFGKFVNAHLTGHFYFDIHPPLVKLLMAGLLKATTNYTGNQPFELIGEEFLPTTPIFMFRLVPAIAGSLIVPVVFLITRRLHFSHWASLLCTSMACFDNLLLGESREILTDSCLILFICLAFLSHLSVEHQPLHSHWWYVWSTLTGVWLGCALTTKWTSLSVFGIVGISTVIDLALRLVNNPGKHFSRYHLNDFTTRLLLLLGIPLVIYVTSFALFFWTLPLSGPGDPFMPVPFQASLKGSPKRWPGATPGFWDNFFALNHQMFHANKNVATPHHWQSYWYTWPFNLRGIACWNGVRSRVTEADGTEIVKQAFVYLLGNPLVWWLSTVMLAVSPIVVWHRFGPAKTTAPSYFAPTSLYPQRFKYLMFQLYTGWVTSILPYALIKRACFIYHYMPSLLFAILVTGVVVDELFARLGLGWASKLVLVALPVAAFVWAFWFFAPLSYADPMTDAENASRRWFSGWN